MNFRITLYLNHFFHDHRSVCRIFVSNKMQTIKDLQDHISKIFNIKNFVLMAQNQYLPSVESVMVLNHDDILTAVPIQTTSGMCTSTPFANNQATLDITRNSSKIQDSSSDSDLELPKKRKISAETFQKPKNLIDGLKDSTPLVRSFHKTLPDEDTNVTSRKEKKLKKYNLLNQDLQEPCSSQKNTEVENSSNCKEKKSKLIKESVREKVMYFENKDNEVSLLEQNKSKSLEKSNETSSSSPNELDISDMMRKHKLFVKSNSSRAKISMELPKQHNIVKSIIVKNSSHNSSGFKSIETSLHSKTDVASNDNSKTSKKSSSFTYEKPIKFDDGTLNKAKSFISEQTLQINNNNNNNSKLVVENYDKSIKFHRDNTESLESLKIDDDVTDIKKTSKKPFASEKPKILQNIILQEGVDKKMEKKLPQVSKEIIKDVTNDVAMTEIEVPLSNLSMETGSVISNETANGSTSLDQFSQHVTKRKRVRKHKNRKSKEVPIETVPVKPYYDYKLKLPKLPAPVLHIRFDENEDTAAAENKDVPKEIIRCDNSEKNVEIDGQKDLEMETQREIIEDEEIVVDNCSAVNENLLQAEENIELVECSVYEGDFYSHVTNTVDNCPLMLNLPEVGNTIAFKILKITGAYTPEVSNYIIGKVLNVAEDQNTIMINILDGLEETRTPMGKFSLSTEEEEDLSAYQEYEWRSMMEKRLVSK